MTRNVALLESFDRIRILSEVTNAFEIPIEMMNISVASSQIIECAARM
jgi:hypothetical protein